MAAQPLRKDAQAPQIGDMNALLVRVRDQRDRAAFVELFDYFAPRLKSFLLRQRASEAEAEEFVQETMLTVWKQADHFDPAKAAASTWIFTIARNKRIDAARKSRFVTTDLEAADNVEGDNPAESIARALTLETQQVQLQEALKTLPEEQKDLLMRSFFEGKSHGEIATATGLPLGTVKSRIRLALDRLRKSFAKEMA
jgi:RNA polymerase sigma factor (sigma-70 family)